MQSDGLTTKTVSNQKKKEEKKEKKRQTSPSRYVMYEDQYII